VDRSKTKKRITPSDSLFCLRSQHQHAREFPDSSMQAEFVLGWTTVVELKGFPQSNGGAAWQDLMICVARQRNSQSRTRIRSQKVLRMSAILSMTRPAASSKDRSTVPSRVLTTSLADLAATLSKTKDRTTR